MQAAADAMTTELMLFGIAALLLSVFEDHISSICSECNLCLTMHAPIQPDYTHKLLLISKCTTFAVPAPQGGNWYMISQLDGCPCCLKDTHYITECWMADHTCGLDFCNCDGQSPSCAVSSIYHSKIWHIVKI